VVGDFTHDRRRQSRPHRPLNTDGSVDNTFDPGTGANGLVFAVVVQADGKLIIAGDFTMVGGFIRTRVARLNSDGSVDAGFIPPSDIDSAVNAMALQPNGKLFTGR